MRAGEVLVSSTHVREVTWHRIAGVFYHWATWFFICAMVFSQFLCVAWDSTTSNTPYNFGRDPRKGIAPILGASDAPYSDRVVACVLDGTDYKPALVNQLLASNSSTLHDALSSSGVGYRVIRRQVNSELDASVHQLFLDSCNLIHDTLDGIFGACTSLGYSDLMRDVLRIAIGNETYAIADSLPVLIMPYTDNLVLGRHAVAARNGEACVFRLMGAYGDASLPDAILSSVNKLIRHIRTVEWLGRPGGTWRYGWYEDPAEVQWNSDLVSSYRTSEFDMLHRKFNTRSGAELDCLKTTACDVLSVSVTTWRSQFSVRENIIDIDSVFISNSSHDGLFMFRAKKSRTITAVYNWETFLSNASIGFLLARWAFSMLALHHGWHCSETERFHGGIGCLSSARSFNALVFAVLPRLKTILCAISTVGCNFEGQQLGLSEAWFAVYPAIVEFVLLYYSLLNLLAKVLRRRISDALFAPTIVVLCAAHFFRVELAESGWLSNVDARVSTLVFSDEVEKLRLADFFMSDIAMRLNGNVRELYVGKLALFAINLLPLVFAKTLSVVRPSQRVRHRMSEVERAIATRRDNVGGLGLPYLRVNSSRKTSRAVWTVHAANEKDEGAASGPLAAPHMQQPFLESYELIRLRYVVYGGKFVVKLDDWELLTSVAPLRSFFHLWNHRVTAWTLTDETTTYEVRQFRRLSRLEPEILRLDDPRLLRVR